MFKQLVSNLPFSPALINQVGFYARRLKKEEATRRLGLIITALALVMQSFAVFSPPESANASNPSDLIYGGVKTLSDVQTAYKDDSKDYRKILTYAGVTEAEIAAMKETTINSRDYGTSDGQWLSWGRVSKISAADGEVRHDIGGTIVYSRPLWKLDTLEWTKVHGSTYEAFVGTSAKIGTFAIIKDCGNLVTRQVPQPSQVDMIPEANQAEYWGNDCVKFDKGWGETYTAPVGAREVIVKGGTVNKIYTTPPFTNLTAAINPNNGQPYGISHVIVCGNLSQPPATAPATVQKISVCRPGVGVIDVLPTEKKSTDLDANADVCKQKLTVCRPGVGVMEILASEKKTTDLDANADACKPKSTVCRPGAGVITILTQEKLPTDLAADSDACKPKPAPTPFVACSALDKPTFSDRDKVAFTAHSVAQNGATVQSYTFTVREKDAKGNVVETKTVNSSEDRAVSPVVQLTNAGDYYVSVSVKTSLGDKTSADCAKTFTVVPPKTCAYNPDMLASDKNCQPCPGDMSLWINSPECKGKGVDSKVATNLTQGKNAATVTAQAGDRIEYRVSVENVGRAALTTKLDEQLGDVVEYATISDNGGGAYDQQAHVLSWGDVTLKPGEKQTRTFVVNILSTIPTFARGKSEPTSYDCVMNNVFGNTINVKVDCGTPKLVESTVTELPSTGPRENIIFAVVLMSVVTYFYARSRQLGTEVRLVRKDFSMGTI